MANLRRFVGKISKSSTCPPLSLYVFILKYSPLLWLHFSFFSSCDGTHSASSTDRPTQSRIYYSTTNSTPYTYTPKIPGIRRQKILIFSGCSGSAQNLDTRLYINMHRMYYAKRHGYSFVHQLSNQFTSYFPHNTWEVNTCHAMNKWMDG